MGTGRGLWLLGKQSWQGFTKDPLWAPGSFLAPLPSQFPWLWVPHTVYSPHGWRPSWMTTAFPFRTGALEAGLGTLPRGCWLQGRWFSKSLATPSGSGLHLSHGGPGCPGLGLAITKPGPLLGERTRHHGCPAPRHPSPSSLSSLAPVWAALLFLMLSSLLGMEGKTT